LAIEAQEQTRQEFEALKLALISADPTHFLPQFYPEIAPPPLLSNVDALIDTLTDEETPVIDYQLTPPSSAEAARVIESLLADKKVTFNGS
jgi:hypothetical protein